jgi:hypothetical protein
LDRPRDRRRRSDADLFREYEVDKATIGADIFSPGCASPGSTIAFRVGLKSGTTQYTTGDFSSGHCP